MFDASKNLKDTNTIMTVKDMPSKVYYIKINKLITALYIVTDMLEKEEPLRNKLRTLGLEIISDMGISHLNVLNKISHIVSLLDIASGINIISVMNCTILKKEFFNLSQAVKDSSKKVEVQNIWTDLSEFLKDSSHDLLKGEFDGIISTSKGQQKGKAKSIGHDKGHTRIGVQKGSTLMKALSDKTKLMSHSARDIFLNLRKERRRQIINILKINHGGATIKDIKDKAKNENILPLFSCGEKTLQRELVYMVREGVLYKNGSKRWSKYFFKP